jgi:hypothetical protein
MFESPNVASLTAVAGSGLAGALIDEDSACAEPVRPLEWFDYSGCCH